MTTNCRQRPPLGLCGAWRPLQALGTPQTYYRPLQRLSGAVLGSAYERFESLADAFEDWDWQEDLDKDEM